MLILGFGSMIAGFLVALTPLYGWLVLDLMHIPPAVAEVTRPALIIMAIWSLPVAWRRTLQGVLIANNHTPLVTLATIVRVLALLAALRLGAWLMPDRMLIVSAIALQTAVITEALVVTRPAFRIVRELPADPGDQPLTWRSLIHFYQPLAVMMVLRQVSRPMLSAGIAAAQLPQLSLAAWSVAWSLVVLPFGVTMGLEQVAIAKGQTPAALGQVRRFSWGVGLFLSGALLLIAFTPLVHPVLDTLFDLSDEIKPLVIMAMRWTASLPLLQSLQALLRGVAIDQDRTPDVRAAVAVGLAVTALVTIVGPRVSPITGILVGTTTTMLAALAEVSWLAWRERRS
jgi:Na+-driven multidrug efflux pump